MQQLINGLSIGSVYALVALGYSLVFGVLRMINFAHCDIMTLGAYAGYFCASYLQLGFILSTLWAVLFCSAVGIVIERWAYRPLRGIRGMPIMVVAIGLSLLLEYIVMFFFGADVRVYPPDFLGGILVIGGISLPVSRLVALVLALFLMGGLQFILHKTRQGRAMRAVADDSIAARLCGVDEKKIISLAFAIGSALAGVAGVAYGSMYLISPLMGTTPGLKAFAAAVVGGIGSIPGALLGGFALGLVETFVGAVWNTAFKDMIAFIILIVVILFKPGGLAGSKVGKTRL